MPSDEVSAFSELRVCVVHLHGSGRIQTDWNLSSRNKEPS